MIHGGATGADLMADRAAKELGIPTARFDANWQFHGRSAGHIRNQQILKLGQPDEVVAFWDGESPGTANMIQLAGHAGIPIVVLSPAPLIIDSSGKLASDCKINKLQRNPS